MKGYLLKDIRTIFRGYIKLLGLFIPLAFLIVLFGEVEPTFVIIFFFSYLSIYLIFSLFTEDMRNGFQMIAFTSPGGIAEYIKAKLIFTGSWGLLMLVVGILTIMNAGAEFGEAIKLGFLIAAAVTLLQLIMMFFLIAFRERGVRLGSLLIAAIIMAMTKVFDGNDRLQRFLQNLNMNTAPAIAAGFVILLFIAVYFLGVRIYKKREF